MFSKKDALKLWENELGNKDYTYDFAGRKIKKSEYLKKSTDGWDITYMHPIELGGPTDIGNIIIANYLTIEEKGLDYPKFKVLNKSYIVHYDASQDFYYIELEDSDDDDESFLL